MIVLGFVDKTLSFCERLLVIAFKIRLANAKKEMRFITILCNPYHQLKTLTTHHDWIS